MYKQRCDRILKDQQEDMQNENDSDNLNKYHQNGVHLSRMSHIQEDTEDIKRKQGENYRTDHTDDDCLKIPCYVFQSIAVQRSQSQS